VWEADAPAFGITDNQDELDGGIEEVEGKEAKEEGAQHHVEERGKEKGGRQHLGGHQKQFQVIPAKKKSEVTSQSKIMM